MLRCLGQSVGLALVLLSGLACTGSIGGGTPDQSGPGGPGGAGSAGGPGTGPSTAIGPDGKPLAPPPPTVLRRLTNTEYNNTVRDLLADTTRPADSFLVDEKWHGFDNIAEVQTTSPVRAEQYMLAGEKLALQARAGLLANLACAAAGDAACADQFIRQFGQKAYRRPVTEDELTRLRGVFQLGSSNGGFEHGIELLLRAMLVSPSFLFRVEVGEPVAEIPGLSRPTSWEMASRLSYLLVGSLPDAELFQAAGQNALVTKDQVLSQAQRLMADPRAKTNILHLHTQWFGVDEINTDRIKKDGELFPQFDDELVRLARQETEAFLDDIVWNAPDGAKALLTGSYSFMNAKLAGFYGVTGPTSDSFTRVELDPTRRMGILSQVGFLARYAHADQTAPTLRGKFVRERLLCTIPPPPPPAVDVNPTPPTPGSSTRERVAAHVEDPTCAGCHSLLDPIGLGFEHYDAVGAWRDQDGGKPVDATGIVNGVSFSAPFTGVPQLAAQLAGSPEVQACITKHWFRFAYGREETDLDQGVLDSLRTRLEASGGDLKDLLLSLTQSDAFLHRGTGLEAP
jgi:hypothetical protein